MKMTNILNGTSSVLQILFVMPTCRGFRSLILPIRSHVAQGAASFSDLAASQVQDFQLDLSSGVSMQVMSSLPEANTDDKPPLLFLHGSFHGAWCWAENYFPFFTSKGYPVVAPSWRGTGGTYAGDDVKKVKIMEHVADLNCLMDNLPEIVGTDQMPIVVCHSFGGLAVMKALEEDPSIASKLGGIVMMCSVPPSGNGKMTMRYLKRSLIDSYKITVGFAMKRCLKSEKLCRQLFFGGDKESLPDGTIEDYGVSDSDIRRYQKYFERDSKATIDLFDLAKQLPSAKADDQGQAPFLNNLPPCLVVGAINDFIVDKEGVDETATYFGLGSATIVDSPHDVMLGRKWDNSAHILAGWLDGLLSL